MAINVTQQEENKSGGTAALPAVPPAVRREQQFAPDTLNETDDPALNDISTQLLGSKAITGKAMLSSSQVARTADNVEAHRVIDDKKRADDDRANREHMNLAAWNAQKTIVGGVEMTNAEAQAARQYFIDHEDEMAKLAVKRGLIREDQQEELKRGMRREKELQIKLGSGTLSAKAKAELDEWRNSDVGRAGGAITGNIHQKKATLQDEATLTNTSDDAFTKRSVSATGRDDLFQGAPPIGQHFAAAQVADAPLDAKPSGPTPSGPRPNAVTASGFSV